jgi:hypothetical protein
MTEVAPHRKAAETISHGRGDEPQEEFVARAAQIIADCEEAELEFLRAALRKIAKLSVEWNSNGLGSIQIQRERWLRLGLIANRAVSSVPAPTTKTGFFSNDSKDCIEAWIDGKLVGECANSATDDAKREFGASIGRKLAVPAPTKEP